MMLDIATLLRATTARVLRQTADGFAPGNLSAGDLERSFYDVSVDSRTIRRGALFVALPGERVDGHQFVSQALAAGALGCLVSRVDGPIADTAAGEPASRRAMTQASGGFLFVVPDPLAALQQLASYWRSHLPAEIVGVTGSIGKTTTKEIMAAYLSARRSVLKSEANLNTEIGLPLMLLRLKPEHQVAVLEMGMYAAGDIALLARIAAPRIGVVTNVAPIHLERMGTIERIARAKSELVAALPTNGLAVLNGDDPWTRAMAETSGVARSVLIGRREDCDYRAEAIETHGLEGTSFTLEAEGRRIRLRTRVPGIHTVPAFLAAIAVARELGMDWADIEEAAGQVTLEARQRVVRWRDPVHGASVLLIDDSYNASPLSMNAALDLLAAAPGTKIAVLGDMLELGPDEEAAHQEIGRRAAGVADWLITRGPRGDWMADAALAAGFSASRLYRAPSNLEAAQRVRVILSSAVPVGAACDARTIQRIGPPEQQEAAWSVLVKGSRGMRMEDVVRALRGTE